MYHVMSRGTGAKTFTVMVHRVIVVWLVIFLVACNSADRGDQVAVACLQLGVRVSKTVFTEEQPMFVYPRFTNACSTTVTFWDSGFWPNTRVDMFDSSMQPVALTAEGLRKRSLFSPTGNRDKNAPLRVAPFSAIELAPVDVRPLFILRPTNNYFVQFTYEERQTGFWTGRITSNKARIQTGPSRGNNQ